LLSLRRSAARSTLFPYTTLFRSALVRVWEAQGPRSVVACGCYNRSSRKYVNSRGCPLAQVTCRARSRDYLEVDDPDERVRCSHPDRKSTRLNSSHEWISYAVFCL